MIERELRQSGNQNTCSEEIPKPPVLESQFEKGAIVNYNVCLGLEKSRIGKSCHLRTNAVIYGGVIIGDYFHAGHNAVIRENNRIGNRVSVGTNTCIEPGCVIGDDTRIHGSCFIVRANIGKRVIIAPGVVFCDDYHPACPKYKECTTGPIIGDDAVIGAGSIILPGITIGAGAMVAAGSLVTKHVPDGAVVMGQPARVTGLVKDMKCYTGLYERPYDWKE